MSATPERDLPAEIDRRLRDWRRLFKRASVYHYMFGILGVAASSLAAATDGEISRYLAACSGICIAVLGFAQPDRKYMKFVKAWRILDVAALRFKYAQIELPELIEALERGEKSITDFETEDAGTARRPRPA